MTSARRRRARRSLVDAAIRPLVALFRAIAVVVAVVIWVLLVPLADAVVAVWRRLTHRHLDDSGLRGTLAHTNGTTDDSGDALVVADRPKSAA
jgi:hypothetical protein